MTLRDSYFDWMTRVVLKDENVRRRYIRLLYHLDNLEFIYTIPFDENRYIDGLDLRYRYQYDENINMADIDRMSQEKGPCTILEMMVALSLKCEEDIMSDPMYGNRIGNWFLEMITSLKLDGMTNENYDEQWVDYRITVLTNHAYEPNGSGGLFTIPNTKNDLRTVEIWCQMCWYLNSI